MKHRNMPYMKVLFYVLILLQTFMSVKAFSQEPIIFKGDNVIIGQHTAILEDTSNSLDIESVKTLSGFVNSTSPTPNLQLSKSDFWLRFTIKNKTQDELLMLELEYPTLQVCELYYPENGHYKVQKMSDKENFGDRTYKHQNFIFDIHLPQDSSAVFFLRVRSSEQMILPLLLGTPQKVAESLLTKDLIWGVFIGILLVMILYNFFVFISTKDIGYLYYVLYIAFIGLTQTSLSAYTYRYLFHNSPLLFHKGIIIFPALAGISGIFFVRNFLHTKESMPRLDKVFNIVIGLYGIAIILRLAGYDHAAYRMIDISALSSAVVTYPVSIIRVRHGYRPARFFLVAWTIFILGLILFVLRNLGILPYNIYTNYTMQLGVAIEVTLLSIALADKLNILKKEKEQSQLDTLNAIRENERIIREQNVMLEQKVEERTFELKEANEDLNITLDNLKQAQSQLVESEKMASLGQLTAGIAHEINNPINFVTSNVAPLKRDVGMVFDTIEFIEAISFEDISDEEKKKKIHAFKEELDYDYLKIEINHLLSGIYEGSSRTAEIVKGLRIFSRVDENDLKRADINEGLDSTLIIVNNQLNGTLKINKEYTNPLPLIECYPGKLNQVFLNIISNAMHAVRLKHGESGNGIITIRTKAFEDNITVEIMDNGVGMDENTKHKIYEPFFTTKDVGEGTGLGMSIVYNTIKKHNGTIKLVSKIGEGTSFVIQLPIVHEMVSEMSI
jgi:two-component system, NtrC family, sensor kinase